MDMHNKIGVEVGALAQSRTAADVAARLVEAADELRAEMIGKEGAAADLARARAQTMYTAALCAAGFPGAWPILTDWLRGADVPRVNCVCERIEGYSVRVVETCPVHGHAAMVAA